jgi:pSer/pThr/pTyr-binding forkhead associated (FHA) protein
MDTQLDKFLEGSVIGPRDEPRLMVMNGPEDGRIFLLGKEATTLGRADGNQVPLLLDPVVSRAHARVTHEDDGFYLEDLDSRYGTELDGVRLRPGDKRLLRPNSSILVGETVLAFRTSQDIPKY